MAAASTNAEVPVPALLLAIRRRPEIWGADSVDSKREATAWKKVCRQVWPQFNSWPLDVKRRTCLMLQKKWKDLQKGFLEEHKKGDSAQKCPYHDLLKFLVADEKQSGSKAGGPAKRARTEHMDEVHNTETQEDRHFLLSLVSYMHDVPRASKLALREDILRLIRKYTPTHTEVSLASHSQEY